MTIKLGILMDPIESIDFKKDSSLAILLEASNRGWKLFYMEQSNVYQMNSRSYASVRELNVYDDPDRWFSFGLREEMPLDFLDVILMRKDPPFDLEFVYSTYLLERAEAKGTLVVNKPQSLRDCNEKLFATLFPQCIPPLMISRDPLLLKEFAKEHEGVVVKPLDGMGGASIFKTHIKDPNFNVIVETVTNLGKMQVMIQRFIPEISNGDKRVIVVDGQAIPYALARIPAEDEFRGNLAAGGRGVVQALTDRDKWIVSQVAPTLKEKGLLFVGLDIIGDYLTEINITSPTCIKQINNQSKLKIEKKLIDSISDKLLSN